MKSNTDSRQPLWSVFLLASFGEQPAAGAPSRARDSGWQDLAWLLRDPELEALRARPVFARFTEDLAARDAVPIGLPPMEPLPGHSSDI
jgi:hypothetical protein